MPSFHAGHEARANTINCKLYHKPGCIYSDFWSNSANADPPEDGLAETLSLLNRAKDDKPAHCVEIYKPFQPGYRQFAAGQHVVIRNLYFAIAYHRSLDGI